MEGDGDESSSGLQAATNLGGKKRKEKDDKEY